MMPPRRVGGRGARHGRSAGVQLAVARRCCLALAAASVLVPLAPHFGQRARWAAVAAPALFVGGLRRCCATSRPLGGVRGEQRRTPGIQRRGAASFLDDIGEGMKDASLLAEVGLSVEEGEALFKRCKSGNMDFTDFVVTMRFLDHVGGSGGMVQTMSQIQDDSGTSGMAERLEWYKEILVAMEADERSEPQLLLENGASARERVRRLAQASSRAEAEIDQFLLEYRTMVTMLMNLGSGRSMDETTRSMAVLRAEQEVEGKSRTLRRKVKASRRGKKQPEWMKM